MGSKGIRVKVYLVLLTVIFNEMFIEMYLQ